MTRTLLMSLGATLALVACSSSRPATPEEIDDTAQAISATLAADGGGGDVAAMTDAVKLARGSIPDGFTRLGDRRFHGRRLNLETTFELVCTDAAGNPQTRCNASTDAATVTVTWIGSLDTSHFDATVSRIGNWSLTGLQSATATFSGFDVFSYNATLMSIFHGGVTSTYELDTAAVYDSIHIATADRNILDGTAQLDVSAHRTVTGGKKDVDTTFHVHADLTFHADHTATLVIDGTQTYEIDLGTGRCHHHDRRHGDHE